MQRAILFLLFALPVVMAGCDKEKPTNKSGAALTSDDPKIIGSWEMTGLSVDTDATGMFGEVLRGMASTQIPDGMIYEFFNDGTTKMTIPQYGTGSGTFTLKDGLLTMTVEGDSSSFEVRELDNQKLVLFQDILPQLLAVKSEISAALALYGVEVDWDTLTKMDATQTFSRRN